MSSTGFNTSVISQNEPSTSLCNEQTETSANLSTIIKDVKLTRLNKWLFLPRSKNNVIKIKVDGKTFFIKKNVLIKHSLLFQKALPYSDKLAVALTLIGVSKLTFKVIKDWMKGKKNVVNGRNAQQVMDVAEKLEMTDLMNECKKVRERAGQDVWDSVSPYSSYDSDENGRSSKEKSKKSKERKKHDRQRRKAELKEQKKIEKEEEIRRKADEKRRKEQKKINERRRKEFDKMHQQFQTSVGSFQTEAAVLQDRANAAFVRAHKEYVEHTSQLQSPQSSQSPQSPQSPQSSNASSSTDSDEAKEDAKRRCDVM